MSNVDNGIVIDGTEIKESDMTQKQIYLTNQCKDLLNKKGRLEFELDQVQASLNVFQQALVQETKKEADEILDSEKSEGEKK
tara:strand:+ start:121 stop:366 length:246 start_codon:yes stop_codon:yes gene_type:complete